MNTICPPKVRAALALLSGAASFWTVHPLRAQDAPIEEQKQEPQKLEKFTVTGSNIPTTLTASEAGIAPVVTLDRLAIDQSGSLNAAELLQRLTVSNNGAIAISNNNTGFTPGATGVSLHGIGPEATLVLINNHRVASYPVGNNGDTAFVDLNTIPIGMIERIEVLKDGASAVYGADAIAGVVNIILRKSFNGSEAFVSYQNTTDKDSSQFTANLLTGVSNDQGSLLVGFNYQSRAAIASIDRGYSAVPAFLSTNSNPINVQITQASYNEALGLPANAPLPTGVTSNIFFATPGVTPGAAGGNTVPATGGPVASTNKGATPASQYLYSDSRLSEYNYALTQWSYPSWTRYGAILNGERRLFANNDKITAYFDGSYQKSTTENQAAPEATGDFSTPGLIEVVIPARTTNPLAMPDGRARAAATGAFNPFNPFNQDIADSSRYRLAEFGNRILRDTNESFLGTAGIRGENLFDKFNFDAGFRYTEIDYHNNDRFVSANRFNQILNAADPIFNPTSPSYVGTTMPYNPFGYYTNPNANNSKLAQYATVTFHDQAESSLGNGFITINTDRLFHLPGGDVGAAAGFDYRVESLRTSPDPETASGDIIGQAKVTPIDHDRKVAAGFIEFQVPITRPSQNIPGAYSAMVDVAGRYEDFLTNHDHSAVPKIGIRYQPFDDTLTIRGSAAKGFLQPSLFKLYSSGIFSITNVFDNRTGEELEEVPLKTVGNPQLKAEDSNSFTLGIVWSPKKILKGFTTNIDFWRVERNGTALVNQQNTVDRFQGAVPGGSLPGETVLLDNAGNITEVVSSYHNAGLTVADGVDIGASYVLPTEAMGRFQFSASMSYLHSFRQADSEGEPLVEFVDTTQDGEGQDGYLKRKVRTEVTWNYHGIEAGVYGNYLDGFQDFDADGNPRRVASTWTWDVQLSYNLRDRFGPYLKDTKITIGSTNVFNREPPLSVFFGANPNNYPGFIYSQEGRQVYVSLDKKF